MRVRHPHVLGVDDGPFEKEQSGPVPIVGVMMECPHIVESVSVGSFGVDGQEPVVDIGLPPFLGERDFDRL